MSNVCFEGNFEARVEASTFEKETSSLLKSQFARYCCKKGKAMSVTLKNSELYYVWFKFVFLVLEFLRSSSLFHTQTSFAGKDNDGSQLPTSVF